MTKRLWLPLVGILLLAILAAALWRWLERPVPPIPVGMVTWLASGKVVGSSEMNAGDLFLEEFPHTRLAVTPVDDEWRPERSTPAIQEAMARGVRFFVSTHPSNCAVASLPLFADGQALMINTAATSPVLTGRDDFLVRIVPDAVREQQAIARYLGELPGTRLLVMQDTGNRPYTDPAFAAFSAELATQGRWQVVHRPLPVAEFRPDDDRSLMAEPFDALYILAGSFQSGIGAIAQIFAVYHPAAPILLTPWARSPAILEMAGAAIDRIVLPSPYPSRREAPAIDDYFRRYHARFGYEPHAMTIGVRMALELLDQAFAQGYETPRQVRDWLLSVPRHRTSLGAVAFDRFGDTDGTYRFIRDLRQELR